MTTRIDTRFAELQTQGRSAFVTYVMGGDPDMATSLDLIKALPKAGADIIELAPKRPSDHLMVVNLSGRGDKDVPQVGDILKGRKAK